MERKKMKQGFRKNRRDGMVFGVCAGMADHFGFDVLWTRVPFVALTLLGYGLPLLLYLTVAIHVPLQHRAGSLSGAVAPARTFPQPKGPPVSGGPFLVRGDRKTAYFA